MLCFWVLKGETLLSLTVHFLGEPFIEFDGRRLDIPLRKAEAILFYVAFEGRVTREKLKLLFWGDKKETSASNNLRNTMYLLNKALPENCVIDRRHFCLKKYKTDLAYFNDFATPLRQLNQDIFKEPLLGLDLKGLPEFDEWLAFARGSVKKQISEYLRARVAVYYEKKAYEELDETLSALLVLEPFDEDSILELMEVYCNQGYTAKAVSLYKQFKEKMELEVGLSPSKRAEEIFQRLVVTKSNIKKQASDPLDSFYCREKEIKDIFNLVSHSENKSALIFIHGEAGVGKTALTNHSAQTLCGDGGILVARPYSVGDYYPYSSWNAISSQISKLIEEKNISADPAMVSILAGVFHNFFDSWSTDRSFNIELTSERSPAVIGKILADLVVKITQGARPVFIMEDIQWFDPQSIFLLKSFLSEIKVPVTMFLTGRPESASWAAELFYNLRSVVPYKMATIKLTPFSAEDTLRFCHLFLPADLIAQKGCCYFIKQSEGIPLLLVEMLRILRDNPNADCSAGLKGLIMSRMEELSPLQREILSVLSVFGKGAAVEELSQVMKHEADELMGPVEEMLRKSLICEISDNHRFFLDFTHANIRDCVYGAIPEFKKQKIHRDIAGELSGKYSPQIWNPTLSTAICHHYTKAGLKTKRLRQLLYEMRYHITLNHDLFPMIQDNILLSCSIPFSSREDTEYKINQVRDLLHDINRSSEDTRAYDDVKELEASYLEIWGGYLVNWGEYREAVIFINRAVSLATEYGFDEILLHCLEHTGHHFLQTDNASKLLQTGRKLLRQARKINKENHVGIALRFIGMSKLLEKNFGGAEKVFWRSIGLFEELALIGRKYTLNMLASRCYIGEMCQWTGDFGKALEHFEYCIDRCSNEGLFWGRSHFHAHAADAALDMGDWDLMYHHIDSGSALFERAAGGRCGSLLYSLKAIGDAERGKTESALASLEKGEKLVAIGKKTWRAAQLMAKAWIARMAENNEIEMPGHDHSMTMSSAGYAGLAANLYDDIGACSRAEFLKNKFQL